MALSPHRWWGEGMRFGLLLQGTFLISTLVLVQVQGTDRL
jgi:hypothetical protein